MLQGKNIISNFHREIIKAFSQLQNAQQFYLTGGTALAEFYIHHRYSYDLDFFTNEKELILPFSYYLEENLSKKFDVKIIRRFETFAVHDSKEDYLTEKEVSYYLKLKDDSETR